MTHSPRNATRSHKGSYRTSAVVSLVLAVVAWVALFAGPSLPGADATPTWSLSQDFPVGLNSAGGVDCPTASVCYLVSSGPVMKSTDGGQTWAAEDLGQYSGELDALSCPTAADCWAVGEAGQAPGPSWLPLILATTNGGTTWSAQPAPTGAGEISAISCPNTEDCWALGGNGSPASILSTTNAGATWQPQYQPSGLLGINGIECTSPLVCVAVGETSSFGGVAVATSDGGAQWTSTTTDVDSNALPVLNAVSCVDSDCWAAGYATSVSGPVIVASTDGGAQWAAQSPPSGEDWTLNAISCGSASDCVAVGADNFSPAVFDTTDGGTTWSQATLPSEASGILVGVECPSAGSCVATGPEGATGGLAYALLSSDGGQDWSAVAPLAPVLYAGGTCATASECWLYGRDGYTVATSTAVLQETTDGGTTWESVNTLPGYVVGVTQMTCASATTCFAQVSTDQNVDTVLDTTDGGSTWGLQPSTYFPNACPSATECLAVAQGQVNVTVNDGTTWTAYPLATIAGETFDADALACADTSDCWAVGTYLTSQDQAVAAIEETTDGGADWLPETVPAQFSGDNLTEISCPSTALCVAGQIPDVTDLLVLSGGNQSWTDETPTPTLGINDGYLSGLDCPSASTCWAEGRPAGSTSAAGLWQLTLAGGTIAASATAMPPGITDVSATCTSDTSCMALGSSRDSELAVMFLSGGGGSTTTTVASGGGGGGVAGTPTSTTTSTSTTTASTTTTTTSTTTLPGVPLPPGAPLGAYGPPVLASVGAGGAVATDSAAGARVSVKVPAGALPAGTVLALSAVANRSGLLRGVPAGQAYLASFSLSWLAPDGTSPAATSPITMTIVDPTIRTGDTIYILTVRGLKAVGTATKNGSVTVTFTADPAFLVAAVPRFIHLAKTATVKSGAVRVRVSCVSGAACTGKGRVNVGNGHVVLAEGRVKVTAGHTRDVSLPETATGRHYLSAHATRSLKAVLIIQLVGGRPVRSALEVRRAG